MRKVYNFSPGPAMLPEEVLLEAQAEMLNWHHTGMSAMEIGHRGEEFKQIAEQTEADLRDLMEISDDYAVLFIPGGASTQFAMVPMNLLGDKKTADYVHTGLWSKKAIDEAKRFAEINVAATTAQKEGLAFIPHISEWKTNKNASYLHYTPNETVDGVEFNWIPDTGNVPLVADMTSMILSRPFPIERFGIIYAGAQKNMGQAGLNVVIIRKDLIHEPSFLTPTLYKYKTHADNNSSYNTPPTYAWYIMGLYLAWTKRMGGVAAMYKQNLEKSRLLYKIIDDHSGFYQNRVYPECRSTMNVMFYLHNEDLTPLFLAEAAKIGLLNLQGHRVSGGVRASIYNAMPMEGVRLLSEFMVDFAKRNG